MPVHDGSSLQSKCPSGWCPESFGSRCNNWQACPQSHCPFRNNIFEDLGLLCENWGDCCLFGSSHWSPSKLGNCPAYSECPKSWEKEKCEKCWVTLGSSGFGKCPSAWCPNSLSSRCHSYSECPRSHCPKERFAQMQVLGIDICQNWGYCCILTHGSDPEQCLFNSEFSCPRSWSPDQCRKCWPKFESRNPVGSCPLGWCPESWPRSRCTNDCPPTDCPFELMVDSKCFNWGDCCMFNTTRGSGTNTCPPNYACPRSWSSNSCINCWPYSSESLHGSCPNSWCPYSWGSSCYNQKRCPSSHLPSVYHRFGFGSHRDINGNWGDCCMFGSNSACFYQDSSIKF